MREPDMTIPPIEYLTAANARRLRDPRVMGLDAFIHPYTDDAGAASVAQALARLPEHWKATPVCVAFSRLFAVDQTSIVERGDVVEGRRVEARRDPAEVTGIEVLLSCGGARWWTYISRGEIDEFGETGAPASARPHARTRGDSKLHGMLVDDMLTCSISASKAPASSTCAASSPGPWRPWATTTRRVTTWRRTGGGCERANLA